MIQIPSLCDPNFFSYSARFYELSGLIEHAKGETLSGSKAEFISLVKNKTGYVVGFH